jgi:hypothetical protein
LWRVGLRIGDALDLPETDLDPPRGAVLVCRGKGGRPREVRMDRWAWCQSEPWMSIRRQLPVGALLCVIQGVTAGRHWESSSARKQLGRTAVKAGARRRFAPHQLRHAHAVAIGARGRAVGRDPATFWTREPRDRLDLPGGDRQLRDHRRHQLATGARAPGYRWPWNGALARGRYFAGCRAIRPVYAPSGTAPGMGQIAVAVQGQGGGTHHLSQNGTRRGREFRMFVEGRQRPPRNKLRGTHDIYE